MVLGIRLLGHRLSRKRRLFELFKISNGNDDPSPHKGDRVQDVEFSSFKEKIIGVLRTGGYEDKRPCKLSLDELLHLHSLFNQAGIYFGFDHRRRLNSEVKFDAADDGDDDDDGNADD